MNGFFLHDFEATHPDMKLELRLSLQYLYQVKDAETFNKFMNYINFLTQFSYVGKKELTALVRNMKIDLLGNKEKSHYESKLTFARDALSLLFQKGADPNVITKGFKVKMPLYCAAAEDYLYGLPTSLEDNGEDKRRTFAAIKVFEALLDAGAHIDFDVMKTNLIKSYETTYLELEEENEASEQFLRAQPGGARVFEQTRAMYVSMRQNINRTVADFERLASVWTRYKMITFRAAIKKQDRLASH